MCMSSNCLDNAERRSEPPESASASFLSLEMDNVLNFFIRSSKETKSTLYEKRNNAICCICYIFMGVVVPFPFLMHIN